MPLIDTYALKAYLAGCCCCCLFLSDTAKASSYRQKNFNSKKFPEPRRKRSKHSGGAWYKNQQRLPSWFDGKQTSITEEMKRKSTLAEVTDSYVYEALGDKKPNRLSIWSKSSKKTVKEREVKVLGNPVVKNDFQTKSSFKNQEPDSEIQNQTEETSTK